VINNCYQKNIELGIPLENLNFPRIHFNLYKEENTFEILVKMRVMNILSSWAYMDLTFRQITVIRT
jgi:hypothetical protein